MFASFQFLQTIMRKLLLICLLSMFGTTYQRCHIILDFYLLSIFITDSTCFHPYISIHISYLLLGIFTEIISIFNIHLMCNSILRSPVVHNSLPAPFLFIVSSDQSVSHFNTCHSLFFSLGLAKRFAVLSFFRKQTFSCVNSPSTPPSFVRMQT